MVQLEKPCYYASCGNSCAKYFSATSKPDAKLATEFSADIIAFKSAERKALFKLRLA